VLCQNSCVAPKAQLKSSHGTALSTERLSMFTSKMITQQDPLSLENWERQKQVQYKTEDWKIHKA